MAGPLQGIKIIEIAGLGPGPFCGMLLADLGADIIRVDRISDIDAQPPEYRKTDILNRGRRSIALDLKKKEGAEAVLRLVETADAIFEGFRPGVVERLGIGPEACLMRNPKIIYGHMTGFGQDGAYAQTVGHDLNYIAVNGVLHSMGEKGSKPVPPLNLAGDFGGGGVFLALGILSAIIERASSGKGQVVDAAMVDGSSALLGVFYAMYSQGVWSDERGTNHLDGGSHFYNCYETADGKYVSVAPIEPHFYAELLIGMELDKEDLPEQWDRDNWGIMIDRFAEVFKAKSRDEWCEIMQNKNACFAPVLSIGEAIESPFMASRNVFSKVDGVVQPNPAPRFSRTKAELSYPPTTPGADTNILLEEWGFSEEEIKDLQAKRIVA